MATGGLAIAVERGRRPLNAMLVIIIAVGHRGRSSGVAAVTCPATAPLSFTRVIITLTMEIFFFFIKRTVLLLLLLKGRARRFLIFR